MRALWRSIMHGVIREKKTGRERGRQADKGMRRTSQRLPRATTTIHGDGRRWDGTDLPHRQTGGDTPHATAPWNGRNKSNPARARTRRPTPKPESFPSLPISSVLLRSNSVAASNLRPHQPTLPSAAASPPAPRIEEEEPTSFPRQPRQAQGLPHRQPHLGFSVLPDCPPWGASARGGSRRSHRRRRRRSPAPTARAAAGTGRGTSTPASSPSRRPSRHRPTR